MTSKRSSQYIHFLLGNDTLDSSILKNLSGKYVHDKVSLHSFNIKFLPSFFLDVQVYEQLNKLDIRSIVNEGIETLAKNLWNSSFGIANKTKKSFLINIRPSYDIGTHIPTIFNVGLNSSNIKRLFSNSHSINLAYFMYAHYLSFVSRHLLELRSQEINELSHLIDVPKENTNYEELAFSLKNLMKDHFPEDPIDQLTTLLKVMINKYCSKEKTSKSSCPCFIIEPKFLAYPKIKKQEGYFSNYAIESSNKTISGNIYNDIVSLSSINLAPEEFAISKSNQNFILSLIEETKNKDFYNLNDKILNQMKNISEVSQGYFKTVVKINFILLQDEVYVTNFQPAQDISTSMYIKNLCKLYDEDEISAEDLVSKLNSDQLVSLLHPVINSSSIAETKLISDGIVGAIGAAVGRVCFSADTLLEKYRLARLKGDDDRFILCVKSSHAEDVKAIELAQGVLSVEGGYADHASVVARSVGKVSLINPKIFLEKGKFTLKKEVIKEGDYITLDVNTTTGCKIYLGKIDLIKADIDNNGLLNIIDVIKKFVKPEFLVRANADQANEVRIAKKLGAQGIGLCRTEHMFFAKDRIQLLRRILLSNEDTSDLSTLYKELERMQYNDFYEMLKIMSPHPVTIRLLDAPLHEFLPDTDKSKKEYLKYLETKGKNISLTNLERAVNRLQESNPMLGNRGCRMAVSYPEIYHSQVRAILSAALRLQEEGIHPSVEIMIPLIFSVEELSFIKHGKKIEGKTIKGIQDVADLLFLNKNENLDYKVGIMLELPSATLQSDRMACFSDFFSFGTNDLTQTTLGISRDDMSSFFPVYTEYDLLVANPFTDLYPAVKELMQIAITKIKLVKPNAKIGICGAHATVSSNIEFCMNSGLDYVSCATYGVPLALLAIAQKNIQDNTRSSSLK